jgi:nucleoside phosphorylase
MEAQDEVEHLASQTIDERLAKTLRTLGRVNIVHELHSIGFIGYREKEDQRFIFCHDGRLASADFSRDLELMIHPCYWLALGYQGSGAGESEPDSDTVDIFDEYDEAISVTSVSLERRKEILERVASDLDRVQTGDTAALTTWLQSALSRLLASGVRDIEKTQERLHGRVTSANEVWCDLQSVFGMNRLLVYVSSEQSLTGKIVSSAASWARSTSDTKVVLVCTMAKDDAVRKGDALDGIRAAYDDGQILVAHLNAEGIQRALRRFGSRGVETEPSRLVRTAIEQSYYSYVHVKKAGKKSRKRNARCDLLLVVATKVERDAVLECSRDEHALEPKPVNTVRRNYFYLGELSGASIYLVQCEMGSAGTGGSQATVADALAELRPKNIVMVGIAFGLKPDRHQLGDVLVAQKLFDYESLRLNTESDGSLTSTARGDRVASSAKLVTRLRSADYDWTRAPVHFGLIVSGQKLVDNERSRAGLLRLEPEAIGGEMEGAGLYGAAQGRAEWVLVKAICDWGDGKKAIEKAERQERAAANAASFVLHAVARHGLAR